jgi:hypothetical protein
VKISELIDYLKIVQQSYGDLEVWFNYDEAFPPTLLRDDDLYVRRPWTPDGSGVIRLEIGS